MDTIPQTRITEPGVSILMLAYNRARFLTEAIKSVEAQTYRAWELIIIDDGSTDNTAAIVATFQDPRIRYVRHEKNAGLLVRRKESLTYATGTYTAILDSDDYWTSPDKLQKQVDFLETHTDHVLVGTFPRLIDASGMDLGTDTFAIDDRAIRNRILLRNQFTHSSVLMSTEALTKTEGYRRALAEDLDLFLQLGAYGKFANIPEAFTAHRIHEGSANDRGSNMARAIDIIVREHAGRYPHSTLAGLASTLRLLRARLRTYARH